MASVSNASTKKKRPTRSQPKKTETKMKTTTETTKLIKSLPKKMKTKKLATRSRITKKVKIPSKNNKIPLAK